nr:hypothetical protein [Acetobacter pomorum]
MAKPIPKTFWRVWVAIGALDECVSLQRSGCCLYDFLEFRKDWQRECDRLLLDVLFLGEGNVSIPHILDAHLHHITTALPCVKQHGKSQSGRRSNRVGIFKLLDFFF